MLHPWREVSHLAVITIIRKPHLGTNEQDLLVVNDHPAVVDHVLVYDWPAGFGSVHRDVCRVWSRTFRCRKRFPWCLRLPESLRALPKNVTSCLLFLDLPDPLHKECGKTQTFQKVIITPVTSILSETMVAIEVSILTGSLVLDPLLGLPLVV